jgi:predicted RNA binding protein YcfA (HicA-like mRNA interferase family)
MAIDDLSIFNKQLPEVFEKYPCPFEWDDKWIFIGIDSPEKSLPTELDFPPIIEGPSLSLLEKPEFPEKFPGGPLPFPKDKFLPPPDALAFYLPFHYFYPVWWGIYLTYEGIYWLANYIKKHNPRIKDDEALLCSQIFLYAHEAYHHMVESFATRLEVTHRVPLYKTGFQQIYRDTMENPDQCADPFPPDEESLANAYAYLKTLKILKQQKAKMQLLDKALESYFSSSPPCYKRALEYLTENKFKKAQCEFAEFTYSTYGNNQKDGELWFCYPYAFSGMARITSKVKYIIHRNSPLFKRSKLFLWYLPYRELKKKLEKLAKCKPVRQEGGHEIWEAPTGKRFPVPRHPGDLKKGTVAKIIKQAGLNMTFKQFIQAKA